MNPKNHALATRFAVNLVGAMLQRSAVDFFYGQSTTGDAVDFLVRKNGVPIAIEVKYVANPHEVNALWASWQKRATSARLVIVTGNGEAVFTDQGTASLLMTDQRTSLSTLPLTTTAEQAAIPA